MEKKKKSKADILTFLSDVGFGVCLGIILDQVFDTTFICTLAGFAFGIGLAILLKNAREKENEKK